MFCKISYGVMCEAKSIMSVYAPINEYRMHVNENN